MKIFNYAFVFLLLYLLLGNTVFAQTINIKGVVKDKESGETIPLILVDIPNTDYKVQADFDGNFLLKIKEYHPNLRATCIGYKDALVPLTTSSTQEIEILLESSDVLMNEVVIVAPENPAYRIMRKVVENKSKHNPSNLEAYQYEFYVKSQIDVDNISEDFKKKKLTKKIGETLAESSTIVNEKGKEVIPVFLSESLSDYYFKKSPEAFREYIKASSVKGIGIDNESFMSQFMGATFIRFNFYDNIINVVNKPFVSPISDHWKFTYHYVLEDSVYINGVKCYELDVKPKRAQDLAVWGKIWIADSSFALVKVDVIIPKETNINFIDLIHLKKDWKLTKEGYWFENNTDVYVDLYDINKNAPGMIVKFHSEVHDIVFDQPKEKKFYEVLLEVAEDANDKTAEYWDSNRKNELSENDKKSLVLIDSLKNTKVIRSYVDVLDFVIYGHKKFNKIEIGPYIHTYSYNNVEGHRFRLGFRTNEKFSRKIALKGYLAYGTQDEKFKFFSEIRYIQNRVKWTEFGVSTKYELERLGVTDQNIGLKNNLFSTLTRWGNMTGAYYNRITSVYAMKQLNKNFSQKVGVRTWEFDPVFNFAYYNDYPKNVNTATHIKTAELVFNTRYAKNETFLQSGNNRFSTGAEKGPEIDAQYIYGSNATYGQYEYHKIDLQLLQRVHLSHYGTSKIVIGAGKVFGVVPYPLLKVHFGNQFRIYNQNAYNMMNFFEFVSDQYTTLQYEHLFNGFFFNRIPLFAKLKWREVVNFNMVWGSVKSQNLGVVPEGYTNFISLEKQPYTEVGYGIENIFKFVRVEMFHRLSYLDQQKADKWGIKIGFLFRL